MKMSFFKLRELIIPLTLLAFIGPGINILNWVLNETTRWGVLATLTFFLLYSRRREMFEVLRRPLFWVIQVYALWGLMTVTWSEVPQISLAKALVFFWVVTTMLIAGYSWVMRNKRVHACDFLWLFAVFALIASFRGESVENENMDSALYAGMTGNPNFLGVILAVASVWLIWRAYLVRLSRRRLFSFYLGLLALDLYFLFLSHSRASQLISLFVTLGLLMGLGKIKKFLPYTLVFVVLIATIYNFSPAARDFVVQYAFKTNLDYLESVDVENAILFSREQIWQESYELAMRGGILGGGYGVTIGESFQGEIGTSISSGKYGREQGNTQLAILEQTGLIGFGLYLMLIVAIIWIFISGLRGARIAVDRVAIGLLGGLLFGMLIMSVFEAWWVAPGSAESATFWMLLGALLGITRRARLETLQRRAFGAMPAKHEQSLAGVSP